MSFKIYTKKGDSGKTSLYGGTRVSKASDRVETYGTIDELNSFIGMARALISNENILTQLSRIQFDLFTHGSECATPPDKFLLTNGKPRLNLLIQQEDITLLESWIDEITPQLPPLEFFILPAGGKASSTLHIARTVCRRAERCLVSLAQEESIRPELIQYLNRLSDYLFVLARYASVLDGEPEAVWNPAER